MAEILAIEKTKRLPWRIPCFRRLYSPLEGIGPEDLTIDALIELQIRDYQRVILATNQTPKVKQLLRILPRKLKGKGIEISCLARGLP